ncbi:hypothetical protein [Absidia glauca]|uniref:Zn(2)-C6 fungal-type domain-containing protein n=1 Tax=Absidia glauca TaxID=4829 RepID=A0A168SS77_ABSGL|nr:hypothetical protein [Absidia glauca]
MNPPDEPPTPATTVSFKKMRMTLACVRCRSKKVRCDYAHPSCKRCSQVKEPCSYAGSSTQVDLFNIVKLNDIVGTLQERVSSLESTLNDMHQTTQKVTDDLSGKGLADQQTIIGQSASHEKGHKHQQQHQWTLSVTPTGLRIDTNIVNPPNLYDILLSGISQLDLNQGPTIVDESGDSAFLASTGKATMCQASKQQQQLSIMVTRKTPLWRSKCGTFPLYSTWSSNNSSKDSHQHPAPANALHSNGHRHHPLHNTSTPPVLDTMIEIYNECFLCLPEIGYEGSIDQRYHQGTLDPLLANAIFAWSARHGAIYHDLFAGQDPNEVGECYFTVAKDLLKNCFMIPSMDTLHALLMLYVYATGRPSKPTHQDTSHQREQSVNTVESEAYIFLGLAIRMCLDLKLHEEETCSSSNNNTSMIVQERYRRFFWVLYFLETLCSLHSDRPFSLPTDDQMTVAYPDMLGDERGERRWRTEFMMKRFRITRIYRDIIQRTAHERLLLSSITELDTSLSEWYDQLPSHLKYSQGDHLLPKWASTSFREQACLKLNFEYQFQRCQLYAVFLKRHYDKATDDDDDKDASFTMEQKAKEVCLTATTLTIELMQCWNQMQQRWCHFSLDPLMMAVSIFEVLLNDVQVADEVRERLTCMLAILQTSPIQHHRYVVLLMARIRKLAGQRSTDDNDDNEQQLLEPNVDVYRFQRLDGMMEIDFCDLPFSDFLYNPVLDSPDTAKHQRSWVSYGLEDYGYPPYHCPPSHS